MYATLITFFAVSVVVSFLCSLWEAVLLRISPSCIQRKLNEGGRTGKILKGFRENIDKPLAAILTVNTIAHTAGAVGVGQEASKIWADTNPMITGLLVPALMTAAILLLSEIIPKTIGANNWKLFAPFTVKSLDIVLKLTAPIVWVCQLVTKLFNSKKQAAIFNRTDFLAMAQIGSEEGELDASEAKLIRNLLNFKSHKVKEVMTPRTVMVTAPQAMTARDFYTLQKQLAFSRILLTASEHDDTIIGYILKDAVLEHLIEDAQAKELIAFRRDILSVPATYNILRLFNDFIQKREHIALVVDEFGSVCGLVTMEDIIETLLGAEIVDETDTIVDMQAMAKKQMKSRIKKHKPGKL